MRPLIQEIATMHTPESLVEQLRGERGVVLLRSHVFESPQARYSFVAAAPFLTFRSRGSQCQIVALNDKHVPLPPSLSPSDGERVGGRPGEGISLLPFSSQNPGRSLPPTHAGSYVRFGNPWHALDELMSRYELLDEVDLPFPLGGCFGFWGYDLKNFVEPKLPRRAVNDLELPDCHVGFYDSLVVFDHLLGKTWVVSTGLCADGSRDEQTAKEKIEFWSVISKAALPQSHRDAAGDEVNSPPCLRASVPDPQSNITREEFVANVTRAQQYIRAGDIYQVNLSQRLSAEWKLSGWELFRRLSEVSPAPFSAYFDCGDFQIASSSPERFLRLSGSHIQTRPIKGTRPRSADADRDAQLTYELQTSAKEMAELVMITDLLRNDLGKVCEFGSVNVPELVRLERFAHVQHLVSTVEGRLRGDVTHFAAFASCFPGGSITGAPKFRAMEIIDELEPTTRGPYCGALGYLGFNRESQLSITIRTAICKEGCAHFNVGAGIVADSNPDAEYEETLAKARGFFEALQLHPPRILRMDTNKKAVRGNS